MKAVPIQMYPVFTTSDLGITHKKGFPTLIQKQIFHTANHILIGLTKFGRTKKTLKM